MEPEEALSFVSFVFDKREDEMLFQRWVNGLQYEMSFDEFKQRLKPKPIKSESEILTDVKQILNGFVVERRDLRGNI